MTTRRRAVNNPKLDNRANSDSLPPSRAEGASAPPVPPDWSSMDGAPKDGTAFLGLLPNGNQVVAVYSPHYPNPWRCQMDQGSVQITAWRSLEVAPPAQSDSLRARAAEVQREMVRYCAGLDQWEEMPVIVEGWLRVFEELEALVDASRPEPSPGEP